ncbi:MAG: type II secretion system protein GspM [Geminicoccaceae bacterium]
MMDRLSPSARKLVAVLVLVLVVAAVAALAAAPWLLLRHQDEELARVDKRLEDLRARLPLRDELTAKLRALQQNGAADQAIVRGATSAIAAASLQEKLAGLATEQNVAVDRVQILESEAAAPYVKVGLRIDVSGTVESVRNLLYTIETGQPVLFVRAMDLRLPEASDTSTGPSDMLAGSIEVFAYAEVQEAPQPSPGSTNG